jgi:cyclopropane-fatty-acyl-phospholipid synthase
MSLTQYALAAAERMSWPDVVTRAAIQWLVSRTSSRLDHGAVAASSDFASAMSRDPISSHSAEADAQHYEVPVEFFALVLGPQCKYSCCLYDRNVRALADAEEFALAETAKHAGLADGQQILELGCGWGSLSLWMARQYPRARIMAVSNSQSQRAFIEAQAQRRHLTNLDVVTCDMNDFGPGQRYDRVVSVEMFEHMTNWRQLLGRVRTWLTPEGRLFVHVFTHRSAPYRFEESDKSDWIAQHFFGGGIMPSHDLIRQFQDLFSVEAEWRWSGINYQRTARDWLANFDRNGREIAKVLRSVYGDEAPLRQRRWRLFFLATEKLFGHQSGKDWGVSHYLLAPTPPALVSG